MSEMSCSVANFFRSPVSMQQANALYSAFPINP
jgi:hypothetical protein